MKRRYKDALVAAGLLVDILVILLLAYLAMCKPATAVATTATLERLLADTLQRGLMLPAGWLALLAAATGCFALLDVVLMPGGSRQGFVRATGPLLVVVVGLLLLAAVGPPLALLLR